MSNRTRNHPHWNDDPWDSAARTASQGNVGIDLGKYDLSALGNGNVQDIDLTYKDRELRDDPNRQNNPIFRLFKTISDRLSAFRDEVLKRFIREREDTEKAVLAAKNQFNDRQSKYAAALDAAQSYGSWTIEKRFDLQWYEDTFFWIFSGKKPKWGIVPVWHGGQVGPAKNCHVDSGIIVLDQPGLWRYNIRLLLTEQNLDTPPGLGDWPKNYKSDIDDSDTWIRVEVWRADASLQEIDSDDTSKLISRQTEQFGQKQSKLTANFVELVHTAHCDGTVFLDSNMAGQRGAKLVVKVWGAIVHAGAESTRVTVDMLDTSHLVPKSLKEGGA